MSNEGAIGFILDELITVLETLAIEDYEKETIDFGVKLLKYVGYLAYKEGIDLQMEHKLKEEEME